jgi:hypothetical protein
MGTDLGRGLPVEANGRHYLLIEVSADDDPAVDGQPLERTMRLLVDRFLALARDLGRTEKERDALADEITRLRASTPPAAWLAAVRQEVEDSWTAPGQLRSRRASSIPARLRWPARRR